MSSSKSRRVTRGPPPRKPIKRRNPASCLPELMRDFEQRCAYSMQHYLRAGKLEVDHFNPKYKNDFIQDYNNLFPASRHCNRKKWDSWPTNAEVKAGCRFLNPCEEVDYGEQIFEDPVTHRLVGTTTAAKWHIRICGLNADHLVHERKRRTELLTKLRSTSIRIKAGHWHEIGDLISSFKEEIDLMIPEIAIMTVTELPD